jgi:hypothetical protein
MFQVDFCKCKSLTKPTFYNERFYSSMCQVYSTKEKVDLFFGDAFWIYNDLYAITSYMYISLKFLMKK